MNELLKGVNVLDFSEYIAGPYCGFLLADFGARVIKIEPPDGAEERRLGRWQRYRGNTRMSLAFNRGKESLSIDLRRTEGQEIVHKLVASADVVVQNFAPGAAEKLNVDYQTLSRINPRLIFLSSTAYGEVGPYRKRKGFDIIAHAASGVMSNYANEDGIPRAPGAINYIDISTGMLNALAVVSALYHRDRSGEGQKIETSLFNTGLTLQSINMVMIDKLDALQHREELRIRRQALHEGKNHSYVMDKIAELTLRSDMPETTRPIEVPECRHRPTDRAIYPYYFVYATADGYLSIAAITRAHREKLCAVLDVVDEHIERNPGDISDEAYFKLKELMRTIALRLKQSPTAHWLQVLEAAGVPCGQVNYRADLYTDPQAEALGMIWQLHNRDLGAYKSAGHPIRFTKTPVRPGRGAPTLGENSESILFELGCSMDTVEALRATGVVKVADKARAFDPKELASHINSQDVPSVHPRK